MQQEQREPEPDIDLVSIFEWMEAAVETGLRIEFRWGTAASLDPAARHKRIAMSAAMPNSPFFQKDTKWQKMTKEHDTVIGAIVELMGMLPPMETKE